MKRKIFSLLLFFLFFFSAPFSLLAGRMAVRKLFEKSYFLYQEEKHLESIELANQVISLSPRFYPAYNLIGFNRIREEINILDAVYYFKKSLEIEPAQPQIYNIISVIYNQLGNSQKGYFYLKEGLAHNPDDFQLNYNAGLAALLVDQDPRSAMIYLEKADQLKEEQERLLYLLGASYLFTNKKEMTLGTITRLRKKGNEAAALKLESLVRSTERGETIDLIQVIEFYSQQPRGEVEKEEQSQKPQDSRQEVEIGAPQTTIKGRGTIQIRQRFKPAE